MGSVFVVVSAKVAPTASHGVFRRSAAYLWISFALFRGWSGCGRQLGMPLVWVVASAYPGRRHCVVIRISGERNPRPATELCVDLVAVAEKGLSGTKGSLLDDRLIGTGEGDLDAKILVNPLGAQTRLVLGKNERGMILAKAPAPGIPGGRKWVSLKPFISTLDGSV